MPSSQEGRPQSCSHCGAEFESASSRRSHMRRHQLTSTLRLREADGGTSITVSRESEDQPWACPWCDWTSFHTSSLHPHVRACPAKPTGGTSHAFATVSDSTPAIAEGDEGVRSAFAAAVTLAGLPLGGREPVPSTSSHMSRSTPSVRTEKPTPPARRRKQDQPLSRSASLNNNDNNKAFRCPAQGCQAEYTSTGQMRAHRRLVHQQVIERLSYPLRGTTAYQVQRFADGHFHCIFNEDCLYSSLSPELLRKHAQSCRPHGRWSNKFAKADRARVPHLGSTTIHPLLNRAALSQDEPSSPPSPSRKHSSVPPQQDAAAQQVVFDRNREPPSEPSTSFEASFSTSNASVHQPSSTLDLIEPNSLPNPPITTTAPKTPGMHNDKAADLAADVLPHSAIPDLPPLPAMQRVYLATIPPAPPARQLSNLELQVDLQGRFPPPRQRAQVTIEDDQKARAKLETSKEITSSPQVPPP